MGFEYSMQTSTPKAPGIILGFDVGSITSAVSFALLLHDRPIEVRSVTWSSVQNLPPNRVPSIMYYNRYGHVMAAGSSAVSSAVVDADDKGWFKVERFKMHLRPYDWVFDSPDCQLGLLPPSKTAIQVMADFLRHLYDETKRFIKQHYVDGDKVWEQVQHHEYLVFSLPNGWDNVSEHRMLQAAIHARLVSRNYENQYRVKFVSEGDANAFSCFAGQGFRSDTSDSHFIIFDAGESMLQAASYQMTERKPLLLKELATPSHTFSGSMYIYRILRELLKRRLQGSPYDNEDILSGILEDGFGSILNADLRDPKKACLLRVGARTANHPQLGIQRGFLKLHKPEVVECFEQLINDALDLIKQQVALSDGKSIPVYIVGVLSSKPWIAQRLEEILSTEGIAIIIPDVDTNSAVADGCVLGLLHGVECEREPRRAEGIICSR